MAAKKRFEKRFNLMLTDTQVQMLAELANAEGMTASAFVRMEIVKKHRATFAQPKKAIRKR